MSLRTESFLKLSENVNAQRWPQWQEWSLRGCSTWFKLNKLNMFIMFHPHIAGSWSATGLYPWTIPFHPVSVSLEKLRLYNNMATEQFYLLGQDLNVSPLLSCYIFTVSSYFMIWNARVNVSTCKMCVCSSPFSVVPPHPFLPPQPVWPSVSPYDFGWGQLQNTPLLYEEWISSLFRILWDFIYFCCFAITLQEQVITRKCCM